MQRQTSYTVQVPLVVEEPNPTELLRAIPGMAATISRQHQGPAELKEALQKIL